MISTASWFFYSTTLWPGYSAASNSNVNGAKNGLSVRVDQYRDITWNDATGDGKIFDSDSDDGVNANGDTITVDGVNKQVHEIGAYDKSTIVVDGVTYTVQLGVWVFDDGTYGVRMSDSAIPLDMHHHKVTQINLGTWNGTDYAGNYVKTYMKPFVCFAAGTMIDTMDGPRPVETLAVGDRVPTLDHGPQPIRWIGKREVVGHGILAPVLIRAEALDNLADIRLSPQHRVLLSGWRAELYCGASEVLVPALHLVNDASIVRAPVDRVTYVHVLFDRHEIIGSEGLLSESFHPSGYGTSTLDEATRNEVLALFPALNADPAGYGPTARMCARRWETRAMLAA